MTTSTPELPIKVIVHEDSSDITIEWDEMHPVAIDLNLDEWTEDDWNEALESGMAEMLETSKAESLNEG
jgi:hypothetical protein